MTKFNLRIGFIGAGSIGSLFGGYLANFQSDIYSIEVIFFNIEPFIDVLNRKGLKIYKNQDILLVKNIVAYENEKFLEDIVKKDPSFKFDFMFLTTKTYDSETALLQYKHLINASNYLVILQNGIGNEDIAIKGGLYSTTLIQANAIKVGFPFTIVPIRETGIGYKYTPGRTLFLVITNHLK